MENPRARNDAIERLLREANGALGGAVAGPCPAPEAVAAWLEGGLSTAEAARLEAHAAACPDCQALVAAFARTLPPEQAHAWASLRWAVPMAAAAVLVLGVWLTRPGQLTLSSGTPESRVARLEDAPATAPRAPAVPDRESADRRLNLGRQALRAPTASSAPAPAVAPTLAEAVPSEERKAEPSEERAKALAPADATEPARLEADRVASPPAAAEIGPAGAGARGAVGVATQARAASAFRDRADATVVTVVSPTGRWRCRVATGGAVEASGDGGLTWAVVGGTTPAVGRAVVGGASPSDGVCWMVGRGGLVILVRDGRATATGPLEAGDLTTVQAEDASDALVRAADGRTWRTRDGGRTWSVAPTGR